LIKDLIFLSFRFGHLKDENYEKVYQKAIFFTIAFFALTMAKMLRYIKILGHLSKP